MSNKRVIEILKSVNHVFIDLVNQGNTNIIFRFRKSPVTRLVAQANGWPVKWSENGLGNDLADALSYELGLKVTASNVNNGSGRFLIHDELTEVTKVPDWIADIHSEELDTCQPSQQGYYPYPNYSEMPKRTSQPVFNGPQPMLHSLHQQPAPYPYHVQHRDPFSAMTAGPIELQLTRYPKVTDKLEIMNRWFAGELVNIRYCNQPDAPFCHISTHYIPNAIPFVAVQRWMDELSPDLDISLKVVPDTHNCIYGIYPAIRGKVEGFNKDNELSANCINDQLCFIYPGARSYQKRVVTEHGPLDALAAVNSSGFDYDAITYERDKHSPTWKGSFTTMDKGQK